MATDTEIKASREAAKNAYGQNGSPLPSSLMPGQTKSPTAGVAPPQVAVPSLDVQDTLAHRVHMTDGKATAYKTHDGLPPRSPSDGSPGGVNVIPATNNHSANR